MKPVVFAGSFDPVTNGHIDLIKRARAVFGAVVVVVCYNATKKGCFSAQERVNLLKEALAGEENISVDYAQGLLADYMRTHNYTTLVRGLRSAHDWNHERTNAYFNKRFNPSVETVFLPADEKYQFVSSSAVKEAVTYGGDIAPLVPACAYKALQQKL